jgi:tungstate transport system substrate-binding protein
MVVRRLMLAALLAIAGPWPAVAADRFITLASTTSTENSGLFNHLLPIFERASGFQVRVVAVGTGQAIKLAEKGDADVLLVHHRPSEDKFVADGFGLRRFDVMYNDYVVFGPKADPAKINGQRDVVAALGLIAARRSPFASRGDDSGTHKLELELWRAAAVDVKAASGGWYRETGSGMGATLNVASAMNAYGISDRATWASFGAKGELALLLAGDARLRNDYGVISINPAKHPHVKATDADAFIAWLTAPAGQTAIAGFRIAGEQLFFPAAVPSN